MNFPNWRLEEHIYKREQQSLGSKHIEKVENMTTIAKFQWINNMEAFGSYVLTDFACQISCESHKWPQSLFYYSSIKIIFHRNEIYHRQHSKSEGTLP